MINSSNEGRRLDKFLLRQLPQAPKDLVYRLIREKKIKVNGKRVQYTYVLENNDYVQLLVNLTDVHETDSVLEIRDLEDLIKDINIVFEDENILVIYKEAGTLSQADQADSNDDMVYLVNRYLQLKYPDAFRNFRSGSINRLDRNTEGLIMFGKTYQTLRVLNEGMQAGRVQKYYLAVVNGEIDQEMVLSHYLRKTKDENMVYIFETYIPGAVLCRSRLRPIRCKDGFSLVEMELETGKSHQLRAQLAYIHHPIVGDPKYGKPDINQYFFQHHDLQWQFLLAYKLKFQGLSAPLTYLNYKTFTAPSQSFLFSLAESLFGKLDQWINS